VLSNDGAGRSQPSTQAGPHGEAIAGSAPVISGVPLGTVTTPSSPSSIQPVALADHASALFPVVAPAGAATSVPGSPLSASHDVPHPAGGQRGGTATDRVAAPLAPPLPSSVDVRAAPPIGTPAAQVFAAAIHRALGEGDARRPDAPTAMLGSLLPAPPAAVAMDAMPRAALDMRHGSWPAAMIERIVTMRDMVAENDTRLRLSPDMLGTIDVSLRRDGDQVQVQISAEQPQTRQMLADAQPRLAELADARGVKLHLTGGQAGGTGQHAGGDAPRQHAAPATNPRPRSAHGHAAADDTDQRIA